MLAYTYVEKGKFELREKEKPMLRDEKDAIVKVTFSSICTSNLILLNTVLCRKLCLELQ